MRGWHAHLTQNSTQRQCLFKQICGEDTKTNLNPTRWPLQRYSAFPQPKERKVSLSVVWNVPLQIYDCFVRITALPNSYVQGPLTFPKTWVVLTGWCGSDKFNMGPPKGSSFSSIGTVQFQNKNSCHRLSIGPIKYQNRHWRLTTLVLIPWTAQTLSNTARPPRI